MVEFVLGKIEPADQGSDRTVLRADGHKGTFNFRQLGNFPSAFGRLHHPYYSATFDFDVRARFIRKTRLGGLQAVACNFKLLCILANGHNFLGTGFQHHGRHDIAIVWVVIQHLIDGIFHLLRLGGQLNEFFGTAVNLSALKVHDALTQGLIGCILF